MFGLIYIPFSFFMSYSYMHIPMNLYAVISFIGVQGYGIPNIMHFYIFINESIFIKNKNYAI